MHRALLLVSFPSLLCACGGQTYEDSANLACPTAPWDDAGARGFSAADVAAAANGTSKRTLTWAVGGDTTLTFGVAAVEGEVAFSDFGGDPCGRMEIPAVITFETADKAFAEDTTGKLWATRASSWSTTFTFEDIVGSFYDLSVSSGIADPSGTVLVGADEAHEVPDAGGHLDASGGGEVVAVATWNASK